MLSLEGTAAVQGPLRRDRSEKLISDGTAAAGAARSAKAELGLPLSHGAADQVADEQRRAQEADGLVAGRSGQGLPVRVSGGAHERRSPEEGLRHAWDLKEEVPNAQDAEGR